MRNQNGVLETRADTFSQGPATEIILQAVNSALASELQTVQKWLIAAYLLIQKKEALGHGRFLAWQEQYIPNIPARTLRHRTEAARAVLEQLPKPGHTIDVVAVLTADESKLSGPVLEWRQQWFDFTKGKSIRSFLNSHNGKILGGYKGDDRKDYPDFISARLGNVSNFLTLRKTGKKGFREFTPAQQDKIKSAFRVLVQYFPPWLLDSVKKDVQEESRKPDTDRIVQLHEL